MTKIYWRSIQLHWRPSASPPEFSNDFVSGTDSSCRATARPNGTAWDATLKIKQLEGAALGNTPQEALDAALASMKSTLTRFDAATLSEPRNLSAQ